MIQQQAEEQRMRVLNEEERDTADKEKNHVSSKPDEVKNSLKSKAVIIIDAKPSIHLKISQAS